MQEKSFDKNRQNFTFIKSLNHAIFKGFSYLKLPFFGKYVIMYIEKPLLTPFFNYAIPNIKIIILGGKRNGKNRALQWWN